MRLPKPFYRLPVRFEIERLRAELDALPAVAWAKHPNEIAGNSSLRLISVDGGENDDVNGTMRPTIHLRQSPYLRQVLASFGVVWSRSRLLRLAPGAQVPQHADINYHWFNRVRLHVPITTRPEVRFHCGGETVHMAAGEAWVFDNWRLHSVENPTEHERVHLVADTSGSAAFWHLVMQSEGPDAPLRQHRYDPSWDGPLLLEQTPLAVIMPPAEIDLLVLDLRAELMPYEDTPELRTRLAQFHAVLDGFCRDWRQFYALFADTAPGWPEFRKLQEGLRALARSLGDGLIVRTNRVDARKVLEARVLRPAMNVPSTASTLTSASRAPASARVPMPRFDRPIFIVAAPRSGSTLLFETLAASERLCTLGGEAHWLIEGIPELRPGAPGIDSNRLEAAHCTEPLADRIRQQIAENLQDSRGESAGPGAGLRLLEKTPKNALRIPFFDHMFPDALFVFLWRDPRENISSIMEAWRSGKWKTYNGLEGFEGPWSLLLPPGWQALSGKPLEEIAAYQWECANRIALEDLAALPARRWTTVRYHDLIADPKRTIQRLCKFLDLEFAPGLAMRTSGPLPHSRHTLTPPRSEKWLRNEPEITRVLPSVEATWRRLEACG